MRQESVFLLVPAPIGLIDRPESGFSTNSNIQTKKLPPLKFKPDEHKKSPIQEIYHFIESRQWASVSKQLIEINPDNSIIALLKIIDRLRLNLYIEDELIYLEIIKYRNNIDEKNISDEMLLRILPIIDSEISKLYKLSVYYNERYFLKDNQENVCMTIPILSSFKVKQISTGDNHTLFLIEEGSIFGMGDNSKNQISDQILSVNVLKPELIQIKNIKKIKYISAGNNNSSVVDIFNSLSIWGDWNLQINIDTEVEAIYLLLTKIAILHKLTKSQNCISIINKDENYLIPISDKLDLNIKNIDIATGSSHILVKNNNKIFGHGDNSVKQINSESNEFFDRITLINCLPNGIVSYIGAFGNLSSAIIDHEFWLWGQYKSIKIFNNPITINIPISLQKPIVSMSSNRIVLYQNDVRFEWNSFESNNFKKINFIENNVVSINQTKYVEIYEKSRISIKNTDLTPKSLIIKSNQLSRIVLTFKNQNNEDIDMSIYKSNIDICFLEDKNSLQHTWSLFNVNINISSSILITEVKIHKNILEISISISSQDNSILTFLVDGKTLNKHIEINYIEPELRKEVKMSVNDISTTCSLKSKSVNKQLTKNIFLKPIVREPSESILKVGVRSRSKSVKGILFSKERKGSIQKSESNILEAKKPILAKLFNNKKKVLK